MTPNRNCMPFPTKSRREAINPNKNAALRTGVLLRGLHPAAGWKGIPPLFLRFSPEHLLPEHNMLDRLIKLPYNIQVAFSM